MCLALDSHGPSCQHCLDDAFIVCAQDMGCQGVWDAEGCCYDAHGCTDGDCLMRSCPAEYAAVEACFGTVGDCTAYYDMCFF